MRTRIMMNAMIAAIIAAVTMSSMTKTIRRVQKMMLITTHSW